MKKKKPPVNYKNIFMTPEYLYNEGIKFYKEAIQIEFPEEENLNAIKKKNFNKAKENYFKAIIYFQGAMIFGSKEACGYLSEFYNKNHLGINNQDSTNLIKMISIITNYTNYIHKTHSIYLKNFGINSNSDLEELVSIETAMINTITRPWYKIPVPEYLVLTTLTTIINDFNSYIPSTYSKYRLITDESIFDHREEILKIIEQERKEKKQELIKELVVLDCLPPDPTPEIPKEQILYNRPLRKRGFRGEFEGDTSPRTTVYGDGEDEGSGSTHKLPLKVEFHEYEYTKQMGENANLVNGTELCTIS